MLVVRLSAQCQSAGAWGGIVAEQLSREGSVKEIAGFELIAKIGQGGMGTVFKARQISLDRIVALKILPPSIAKDAKFIERFQREARATAKLNHPNIVQGVDVGKDPKSGLWYFAMELVDGPSLLSLLKQQRVLPEDRALQITRDIARALECAAAHGFVHRDIKPDNILMTSCGEAKLADLAIALALQAGDVVGCDNLLNIGDLAGKILGHGRPVCLVGRVHFMAEVGAPDVKGDAEKPGRLFPQNPEQDVGEPVDGMGGQAALVGERSNGMVGPVDVGAAVDEVNRLLLDHGARYYQPRGGLATPARVLLCKMCGRIAPCRGRPG